MEKYICTFSGQTIEENDNVFYIFGNYVLEGYEDEYCKLLFGKDYITLCFENRAEKEILINEEEESIANFEAGEDVYFTTFIND